MLKCGSQEKGIIQKAKIFGDFFNIKDISDIELVLENTPHREDAIRKKLESYPISSYFKQITVDELIGSMF